MPSSSAKAAETMSYDAVCVTPFTQIHGCLTRQDYELLKKEVSDLASEVNNLTFAWSRDQATGEEYGLLAEIIEDVEYTHLTNLNWAHNVLQQGQASDIVPQMDDGTQVYKFGYDWPSELECNYAVQPQD